jgi:hypothetical protein
MLLLFCWTLFDYFWFGLGQRIPTHGFKLALLHLSQHELEIVALCEVISKRVAILNNKIQFFKCLFMHVH